MTILQDIATGNRIAVEFRKLATELRKNNIDVWETENPSSQYFNRARELKDKEHLLYGPGVYLGLMIGHFLRPIQWYKNADYAFGKRSSN
jgi:hypothetical protein